VCPKPIPNIERISLSIILSLIFWFSVLPDYLGLFTHAYGFTASWYVYIDNIIVYRYIVIIFL